MVCGLRRTRLKRVIREVIELRYDHKGNYRLQQQSNKAETLRTDKRIRMKKRGNQLLLEYQAVRWRWFGKEVVGVIVVGEGD